MSLKACFSLAVCCLSGSTAIWQYAAQGLALCLSIVMSLGLAAVWVWLEPTEDS